MSEERIAVNIATDIYIESHKKKDVELQQLAANIFCNLIELNKNQFAKSRLELPGAI